MRTVAAAGFTTVLLVSASVMGLARDARAAQESALDFDDSVVKFSEYKLDTASGRYSGPDGKILRIIEDKMAPAEAAKVLKNRLVQLKLLFAPQSAPYPGMLTKDESCAATARFPKRIETGSRGSYWAAEMPATQGLIYGTCGSMDEPYWSQQLLIYCKKEGVLYDVRHFQPKGKNLIGKPVAACRG